MAPSDPISDTRLVGGAGLLGLQRTAGNAAVARLLARHGSGSIGPVQRLLANVTADNVPTPAEAIKSTLNIAKINQGLPGTQLLSTIPRPRHARGEVHSTTIRSNERKKNAKLSNVTSMARAEQFILQGADQKKFYDAGHLVGDQLVAGDGTDSFEYFNLAPQVSEFNTPTYSGMEERIRGIANNQRSVQVNVNLTYPPDYQVTAGHLMKRKIIPAASCDPTKVVAFARRIPESWRMTAVVSGPVASPMAPTNTPLASPSLGMPFTFATTQFTTPTASFGQMVSFNLATHQMVARQWAPAENVRIEDVIGLLAKTFPDLGTMEEVAARIVGPDQKIIPQRVIKVFKEAAGEVALSLLDTLKLTMGMRDPSVGQELFNVMRVAVTEQLDAARSGDVSMEESAGHLITAHSWVSDLQDQLTEIADKQAQQFPFSMTQMHAFGAPQREQADRFDFSQQQLTPDYVAANEMEEEEIESRTSPSAAVDLRADLRVVQVGAQDESRGWIKMQIFGDAVPFRAGQTVMVKLGSQDVTVQVYDITRETNLNGFPTGIWYVSWRHLGAF